MLAGLLREPQLLEQRRRAPRSRCLDRSLAAMANTLRGEPQRERNAHVPNPKRSLHRFIPHAESDLERHDLVRARQRARAHVQRDRGEGPPLPPDPRAGQRPDRLPEVLQEGREARPRRRDREGLRDQQGQARRPHRRGLRGREDRGREVDRDLRLRSLRGDRSDLLRAGPTSSARRTAPRRCTRSCARRWSRPASPRSAST